MLSSVLELLPNLKSTYFASMNPPNKYKGLKGKSSSITRRNEEQIGRLGSYPNLPDASL